MRLKAEKNIPVRRGKQLGLTVCTHNNSAWYPTINWIVHTTHNYFAATLHHFQVQIADNRTSCAGKQKWHDCMNKTSASCNEKAWCEPKGMAKMLPISFAHVSWVLLKFIGNGRNKFLLLPKFVVWIHYSMQKKRNIFLYSRLFVQFCTVLWQNFGAIPL